MEEDSLMIRHDDDHTQMLFCLPSIRLLRDVASLRNKVRYQNQHEFMVTLQLDEIHIKPKMTNQNGKRIGNSEKKHHKACQQDTYFYDFLHVV